MQHTAHSTQSITRMLLTSAQNIASVLYKKVNYSVTREFELSHSIKIAEHMCVPARECQLRRELYCSNNKNHYKETGKLYHQLLKIFIVVMSQLNLILNVAVWGNTYVRLTNSYIISIFIIRKG